MSDASGLPAPQITLQDEPNYSPHAPLLKCGCDSEYTHCENAFVKQGCCVVQFWCEECGHTYDIVFEQNKGRTFVNLVDLGELEWIAPVYRNK